MICQEARESMVASLDGELSPELQAGVSAHLSGCLDCGREAQQLGRIGMIVRDALRAEALSPLGTSSGKGDFAQLLAGIRSLSAGTVGLNSVEMDAGRAADQLAAMPAGRSLREAERPTASAGVRAGSVVRARFVRRGLVAVALAASLVAAVFLWQPVAEGPRPRSLASTSGGRGKLMASATSRRRPRTAQDSPAAAARRTGGGVDRAPSNPEEPSSSELAQGDLPMPPDDLRVRSSLFRDYEIVRRLDRLRNLDEVLATQPTGGSPDDPS